MKNQHRFIVRQAIKDLNKRTIGYEILLHGGNAAFEGEEQDSSAAGAIYDFLLQNSDKSLKGALNFMTFTSTLLLKETPGLFDPSALVIQVDDNVLIHPQALDMVRQYAQKGYKIAVNEFRFLPRYMGLMDEIDYLKLNFQHQSDSALRNIVEMAHSMNKICIATQIDTEELYQKAVSMRVNAMQGTKVAEKLSSKSHSSGYLQSNFFRLMVALSQEEPDIQEIENLISMDASLTYGLMRMANSRFFGRQRTATSIQQALMTVGLEQLRQWIYLLSAGGGEDGTDQDVEEFLKLSLLRATFCKRLAQNLGKMDMSLQDAYLMGMFSTLPYLIDAKMEDIIGDIEINPVIKAALLKHEGRAGELLELALSYGQAQWDNVARLSESFNIPNELLTNIYFSCVEEVNAAWDRMMKAEEEARKAEEAQKEQENQEKT